MRFADGSHQRPRSRIIDSVEPSVVASRCGSYCCLYDRRSGLLARFVTKLPLPSPEIIEIALVGPDGDLFDLGALRRVLDQSPLCRQILLVGASENHPALPSILRIIRAHGVVPSVVVSSGQPRPDVLDAMTRFAGFVALDCGFNRSRFELARTYRNEGLRVSLHLPVADASTEWISTSLKSGSFEHLIHSVTLTGRSLSGPEGQGTGLSPSSSIGSLIEVVSHSHGFRLSTDARIAPHLASGDVGHASTIPRCEAAISGLFIAHDLTVTPCSLIPYHSIGSLAEESLEQIWSGRAIEAFRKSSSDDLPPCFRRQSLAAPSIASTFGTRSETSGLELRFGFASSSLCDRAILPLSRSQLVHIMTSVKDWKALRFFEEPLGPASSQVAASWSSLEYFLSLPPLWGQDLARLHEQLVAGTFEGQEASDLR